MNTKNANVNAIIKQVNVAEAAVNLYKQAAHEFYNSRQGALILEAVAAEEYAKEIWENSDASLEEGQRAMNSSKEFHARKDVQAAFAAEETLHAKESVFTTLRVAQEAAIKVATKNIDARRNLIMNGIVRKEKDMLICGDSITWSC
jgi:hypothetical protein